LGQIRGLKNAKKGFDRSVDRSVELGLGLCYQQKSYPRVGRGLRGQAEGCKNRVIQRSVDRVIGNKTSQVLANWHLGAESYANLG